MKLFLKDNWFKIIIVIIVILGGSVYFIQQDNQENIAEETIQLQQQKQESDLQLSQEKETDIEKKALEDKLIQEKINECISEANVKRVKDEQNEKNIQINICYQTIANDHSETRLSLSYCDDIYNSQIADTEKEFKQTSEMCKNSY